MREQLTGKAVTIFFLPLILMMELHQVSHSVIQAFLARLENPLLALASFSIAFTLTNMLSGLSQGAIQAGISYISDRRSFWILVKLYAAIMFIPFLLLQMIALTSLGDIVFGDWIGASEKIILGAKITSGILALYIYPILARNIAFSLVFIEKRTILITYATVVRLLGLFIFLFIFPYWLKGSAIGSASLVSCMTAEAVFMVIVTYPFYTKLPMDNGNSVSFLDIWHFSWPLMIAKVSENGVAFFINIFLGQLFRPDLAIAAFGVTYTIVRVILAPLISLVQTAQTLFQSRADLIVLLKFTVGLQLVYVGIILGLFCTPARIYVLEGVMGLTSELCNYVTPALRLTFLVAIFWAFSSLFRGMLSAVRSTFAIAVTAMVRLVVICVVGSTAILWPELNGSILGIAAMSGAFMMESLVLGWWLYICLKQAKPLFVIPNTKKVII